MIITYLYIEKLRNRVHRRLIKLAKWSDFTQDERYSLEARFQKLYTLKPSTDIPSITTTTTTTTPAISNNFQRPTSYQTFIPAPMTYSTTKPGVPTIVRSTPPLASIHSRPNPNSTLIIPPYSGGNTQSPRVAQPLAPTTTWKSATVPNLSIPSTSILGGTLNSNITFKSMVELNRPSTSSVGVGGVQGSAQSMTDVTSLARNAVESATQALSQTLWLPPPTAQSSSSTTAASETSVTLPPRST